MASSSSGSSSSGGSRDAKSVEAKEAKEGSIEGSCFAFEGGGGGDDEEIFFEGTGSAEDNEFDHIVGTLEDIMIDGRLTRIQGEFFEANFEIFDDSEENKIEYTRIFEQYTTTMEGALDRMLTAKIPEFRMERFEEMLVKRQDEIAGEIFDLILSLGDFTEFKELILAFKKRKLRRLKKEKEIEVQGKQCASP